MTHPSLLSVASEPLCALEHGVERRSADLRELADLSLSQSCGEGLHGETGDELRLGVGARPGLSALGAVDTQSLTEVVHTASVKYLTQEGKERKVLDMPYIITTTETRGVVTQRPMQATLRRHAAATLDEAQRRIDNHREQDALNARPWPADVDSELPASGATVGPLPDGTVIEVEPMVNEFGRPDVRGYLRGWHFPASMDDAEILDAYNAEQEA